MFPDLYIPWTSYMTLPQSFDWEVLLWPSASTNSLAMLVVNATLQSAMTVSIAVRIKGIEDKNTKFSPS